MPPPELEGGMDQQRLAMARIKAEKARRARVEEDKEAARAAEAEAARVGRIKAREGRAAAWRKGKAEWAGGREPLDPSVASSAAAAAELAEGVESESVGGAGREGRDSPKEGASRPLIPRPSAMEVVMEAPLPGAAPLGARNGSPGPVRMRGLDPVGQAKLKVRTMCGVVEGHRRRKRPLGS